MTSPGWRTQEIAGFIAEYVAPVLLTQGWKRSGRRFTRTTSAGDVAMIRFHSTSPGNRPGVAFYVELAVVPALWRQWLLHAGFGGSGAISEAEGMWRNRLDQPLRAGVRWAEEIWRFHDEATRRIAGQELGGLFTERIVPHLELLLDPIRAVAFIKTLSDEDYHRDGFWADQALAIAMYEVGSGMLEDAEAAVAALSDRWRDLGGDDDAVRFLEARLAGRAG